MGKVKSYFIWLFNKLVETGSKGFAGISWFYAISIIVSIITKEEWALELKKLFSAVFLVTLPFAVINFLIKRD